MTVGKPSETVQDALDAMEEVGIIDIVNAMPDGINTHVISGGKGLTSSFCYKLILARCLAKKPRLLILNDFFQALSKKEKMELLATLTHATTKRTMIFVSNDPLVMSASERVVVLEKGQIKVSGTMEQLMANNELNGITH